ncbi:MAG: nucleotidyltransferase domain-containing protein [Pseudomonadales bacterium]|jgi:predicted nucleotidyltransferase|nr:nucleotidyltransferase domain-containing protein [Pseudomonadales bacterium]
MGANRIDSEGLEAVVEILRTQLPDLEFAYLFGSAARGDATRSSDVDIAVRAGHRIDAVTRFRLQEAIAARLGCDVDLIDLASASTVLRVQVLSDGRVFFERHPIERERFEMNVLSAYARLNEERRDILEDVRHRGTVHG